MANDTTQPAYRPAQQARGARTEARFRQAAEECFAHMGYGGTKVSDIIERSGCSTGSYYHRFKDKRALFDLMLGDYVASGSDGIDQMDLSRAQFGSVVSILKMTAETQYNGVIANRGLLRAAHELSISEPEVWAQIAGLTLRFWAKLEQHVGEYADEISAPDPTAALGRAVQTIFALQLQIAWGIGPLFPREPEEVQRLAVNAALGVLNPSES